MERPVEPQRRRSSRKGADCAAQSLIAAFLLGAAGGCAPLDTGNHSFVRPAQHRAPRAAVHIVSPGETLSSIARTWSVSRQALAGANFIDRPDRLYVGQRLSIPAAGTSRAHQARHPAPRVSNSAEVAGEDPRLAGARLYAGQPRPKPGSENDAVVASAAYDPDAPYDAPKAQRSSAPPDSSQRSFVWPVRGTVISGFGARGSGFHNDGINIAAEPGTPVKAAEAGSVVYAGNELGGYGNLLLVRHANGFVTAYAHNKKLLVQRNDKVRRGQTVALVGATGGVDRPQLHFEVRRLDHRPVDPMRYLQAFTTASR